MPFASQLQPLCRYCAKPIKKYVVTHYFGHSAQHQHDFAKYHPERATTKAEAQRFVNGQIVSIRKGYDGNVTAGVWDGESYQDEFFCTGEHARFFAYAAVRHSTGLAMPCYHEAITARGGQ